MKRNKLGVYILVSVLILVVIFLTLGIKYRLTLSPIGDFRIVDCFESDDAAFSPPVSTFIFSMPFGDCDNFGGSSCKTIGESCTSNSKCCSKKCENNECVRGDVGTGEVCIHDEECSNPKNECCDVIGDPGSADRCSDPLFCNPE
jgi:hypothetical protein